MTRHRRHTQTFGGIRKTTTWSSNGDVTWSSSTGTANNRITNTTKNNGQSYTTYTTRYGDGSYESHRLSNNHKPISKHPKDYQYTYTSREDREELRMMKCSNKSGTSVDSHTDGVQQEEDWVNLPKLDAYFLILGLTAFVVFTIFYFTTVLPGLL